MMAPVQMRNTATPDSTIVEIYDPVAQVRLILDTSKKIAHRQQISAASAVPRQMPSPAAATGGVPTQTLPNGQSVTPQTSTERLGTQTIDGVLAEGTRQSTTWPAGSQGNDRPITSTFENWVSVDLKVAVLSRMKDPRNGENTRKLTKINRTEPDPALFQPPPDYKIVEESGEFEIEW